MKKGSALTLIVSLAAACLVAACGGAGDVDKSNTLRLIYGSEATTLNSFTSGTAADWQAVSNTIDGLVGTDKYGNETPALAESWTVSPDGIVYTFKIRKGLKWVDYAGKAKGNLTAKDFVTVAEYICTPANAAASTMYFEGIIKGAKDFIAGATTDFSTVGFKALDDHTLEIVLEGPLPYFLSYGGSYMPAYTPLFKELGDRYGADHRSIYFIGPYRMADYQPQTKRVYEKNEHYWDKDNVHIKKIVMTYNAEAKTLAPEMFLRGEIDAAPISTSILDEWMKNPKTKDIVIPGRPDTTYMYYYAFNYDPQFEAEYQPDNWKKAVNNENFRQSLYWGLNRYKALLTTDPYNAELMLTNTITPVTWCDVDGVDFTKIGPLAGLTARPNYSFDEAKALEYKAKAVAELKKAGATFPIKMLMPYNPSAGAWELEVQVVKQQLEGLLGKDYIECILQAGPSTGFLTSVRRAGKFAFMKCNNGAKTKDPIAWQPAFGPKNTWTFIQNSKDPRTVADLAAYYALIDEGKEIHTKSMPRYLKFAEAEALLLSKAYVIPFSTDTTGYSVTRYNPLDAEDTSSARFKYLKILPEPLKAEEFKTLYKQWLVEREASLKK